MLNLVRDFFDRHLATPEAGSDERHTIELATAALLVETARLDGEIGPAEREAILGAVRAKFGLDPREADTLVRLAEEEARTANDYYQFTSLINKRFTLEQKERVIELMWQVAYADATLSAHEHHLMRKIGDLLYVPHGNYIAAKMRARDAAARSC
ncbi:MAG TPA: TerB family tellurite resistance protein [Burkholderiales bacterium]|nr:TerB family tellurite resistance protein [Burkholderiales bacterium]